MTDVCDAHFHVFGPVERYPLAPASKYRPPVLGIADYEARFAPLGVRRMVLVQPSCYGTDNTCMLDALASVRERARAVVAVGPDITDIEVDRLHALGVRGIRVNVVGGSTLTLPGLRDVAPTLHRLGWHVQTFLPIGRLPEWSDALLATGLPIVLDHFGSPDPALGLEQPTMRTLKQMLDSGRCWVKLAAPFRLSGMFPHLGDLVPYAEALLRRRPDRLVWGSDWPYIHFIDKLATDFDPLAVIAAMIPGEVERKLVFEDNSRELYGFA